MRCDDAAKAVGQSVGQSQHMGIGGAAHHLVQHCAHRHHSKGIGAEGRTDAAMPRWQALAGGNHPFGDRVGKAVDGARYAATDGFADHHHVAGGAMRAAVPAPARRNRVGLVPDQQTAVQAGQPPQFLQIAGQGLHHPNIGHHRFGKNAGDIGSCQRGRQRVDIVELHHHGRLADIMDLPDQALPRFGQSIPQIDKHIVNRPVIATVEHQDFAAARDLTRPTDHRAIGFARRGGHLPIGQAKPLRQQCADMPGFGRREHIAKAKPRLLTDRRRQRGGRMAEHRGGVGEAEIIQLLAIKAGEGGTNRLGGDQRKRARPIPHPVEGHTLMPVVCPGRRRCLRPGIGGDKACLLPVAVRR